MKRVLSFAAALLLLVNMAACSSDMNTGKKTGTTTGEASASTNGKHSLSIYYMAGNNYIGNAVSEFKGRFKDVDLNQKIFYMNNDDFNKTLSTELLTGGGPDIIICNPLRDIDSVSRVFGNGAFADINKLISKDKDFKLSGYNSKVINAGVFNGRMEFIPIYYSLPVLYSTESVLRQNSISINEKCTVKELSTIVNDFSKNKARKSKYLFDANFSFYYLMNCYPNSFWNYQNGKCDFDSTEFKDLLSLYKNMQPLIAPEDIDELWRRYPSRLLKNDMVAFGTDNFGSVYEIFGENCYINYDFGEDMKVIEITDSVKNNVRPIITDIAAISSICKEKECAFEFIKTLLSEDIQRATYNDSSRNSEYNPVNKSAFKNYLEICSGPVEKMSFDAHSYQKSSSSDNFCIDNISLSDALVKRIETINNNMSKPVFVDKSVKTVIDGAVKDFISGKSSADKTAKLINDKVELFLNE